MYSNELARRSFIAGAAIVAGSAALGRRAQAEITMPKAPVPVSIVDAAGVLTLLQPAFDNYARANPNRVSKINFTRAAQPELPSKIKAQQDAHQVDIDLILGGYDGLTGGFEQKLWLEILPTYAKYLPDPKAIYLDGALQIQGLAQGQGMCISYSPYGPLLEYMPDRVKNVPGTAEELLAWARQNNNRFMYPRPANSGPGRTLMTGLPYILGDANPRDPVKGWDKTWSYLAEIGKYIEYYPSGTAAAMKEFGEGSRDIVAVSLGFDILPRALGTVPKEARTTTLKGFHWTSDGLFAFIPRGVPDEKLAVLFDMLSFILTPKQQAYTYDSGYNFPGPAVKGSTLDLAPEESQKIIKEFGRPEYADLINNNPQELPLPPQSMVAAFRLWDERIGSKK